VLVFLQVGPACGTFADPAALLFSAPGVSSFTFCLCFMILCLGLYLPFVPFLFPISFTALLCNELCVFYLLNALTEHLPVFRKKNHSHLCMKETSLTMHGLLPSHLEGPILSFHPHLFGSIVVVPSSLLPLYYCSQVFFCI
jgi:hypothetical protein